MVLFFIMLIKQQKKIQVTTRFKTKGLLKSLTSFLTKTDTNIGVNTVMLMLWNLQSTVADARDARHNLIITVLG